MRDSNPPEQMRVPSLNVALAFRRENQLGHSSETVCYRACYTLWRRDTKHPRDTSRGESEIDRTTEYFPDKDNVVCTAVLMVCAHEKRHIEIARISRQ